MISIINIIIEPEPADYRRKYGLQTRRVVCSGAIIYLEYSIIHIYRNLHCCNYCCTASHTPELIVKQYGPACLLVFHTGVVHHIRHHLPQLLSHVSTR